MSDPWRVEFDRNHPERKWREVWAGRRAVVVAAAFQRTTTNPYSLERETETHYGVRIGEEDARRMIASVNLLLDVELEELERRAAAKIAAET